MDHPAKLLRIGAMVQRTLNEVRNIELDEAARKRLADVYNRTIAELSGILSDDLRDELSDMVLQKLEADPPPSKAELQLVHAQLIGWLEGLFQGIQASIMSQQLAAQQQLARLKAGQAERGPERPATGQYL